MNSKRLMKSKLKRLFKLEKSEKQALSGWLKVLNAEELSPVKGRILVTALRNHTWTGWAVYAACVLRRMGFATTLFVDPKESRNTRFDNYGNLVDQIPGIEICRVPNHIDTSTYIEIIEDELLNAIAYNHHIEKEDVVSDRSAYNEEIENLRLDSQRQAATLKQLIDQNEFHHFICYSGLIATTPALLRTARFLNLTTVCIEGWAFRKGHLIYNFNHPALEYNIRGWMNHHKWDDTASEFINTYLGNAENSKQAKSENDALKGFYNVQLAKVADGFSPRIANFVERHPNSFLLSPNMIGDSATINRETIFPSIQTWIRELIHYFKENPQESLIIRAHPAEQWATGKVKIQLGSFAKKIATEVDNILVIESHEKVNSFALVPFVKCGLVWLSSIGADLVARGVPVICAAKPKYTGLGFVQEPNTKAEYFESIEAFFKQKGTNLTDEQIRMAKWYLYITFKGFSYPAQDADYEPNNCTLGAMPEQSEHDKFFKIITGEIPAPDELPQQILE